MTSSAGDQSPEASGTGGGGGGGGKRKSEDAAGQPRAKRNRYISIACNECKRRKIKCNGQTPCQRCGNLNLDCVYAPNCCAASFKESEEYRRMSHQISSLQEQVETLFANLNTLRSDFTNSRPQIDPSLQQHSLPPRHRASMSGPQPSPSMLAPPRPKSTIQPKPRQPTFRGPTSVEFNLGVAKNSLQSMGITHEEALGAITADVTPSGSPPPDLPHHPTKDPIWQVSRQEALRLVHLFENEMHEMYPTISIPHVLAHVNSLYTYIEAALRNRFVETAQPGADTIDDDDTNLLKLVLSIAMVVEGSGQSELGKKMYRHVQPAVDALLLGHAGFKGIRMLTLVAMYEFHCDNEARSWRVIGLTVRLCIELGLHRKETYDALPEDEQNSVVLLFWAIYCLDRRWSFGTGMPFALQDSDIDPNLPKPDENSPYLTAMIAHFAIASKVWHAMGTDAGKPVVSREEVGYLDYQVVNWHRQLPDHLRYEPSNHNSRNQSLTPTQHRLQIILYLRTNAMRILIYRPVLHSTSSILSNLSQAQTVVDVAKDTIRILTLMNQTSKMYRTSQVLFNAFLTSALAVLFLAVSHAPALFADQVREEFYLALELVRGFSRGSWVSKRLWRTIRVLKEVGPKLGLAISKTSNTNNSSSSGVEHDRSSHPNRFANMHGTHGGQHDDPSHSAAVAMAGLAGHNVDEAALFGPGTPWAMGSVSSNSPDGMVHDLTSLFEAAGSCGNGSGGGFNGMGGGGMNGNVNGGYSVEGGSSSMDIGFGSEDELSKIMRDLF